MFRSLFFLKLVFGGFKASIIFISYFRDIFHSHKNLVLLTYYTRPRTLKNKEKKRVLTTDFWIDKIPAVSKPRHVLMFTTFNK